MIIFFLLSLIVFTVGIGNAFHMKKDGRIPLQSFLLIILMVTALSMWIAVLPLVKDGTIIYKMMYAAFYVLESAVGNVDYSLFSDALGRISFWRFYTILLHLMMPATTYSVIISYFVRAFGWFRYTFFRFDRQIIIISNLTEKSKAYAKRIYKKHNSKDSEELNDSYGGKKQTFDDRIKNFSFSSTWNRLLNIIKHFSFTAIQEQLQTRFKHFRETPLIIFCNVKDENRDDEDNDIFRKMIFSGRSEMQILKQITHLKDLTIMEMGEDENRNLQKSVEIVNYLKDKHLPEKDAKPISLYTVSSQQEAATIMDNVMKRGTDGVVTSLRQTVINEEKRIAFKLLSEHRLCDVINENTKQVDVMIVGFGRMGQEVLKAISWTGCFPETDTNVHVISKRAVPNGKRLLSECPELGVDLRHEGGFITPECGKQLNPDAPIYYYSTLTDVPKFDEIIRSLSHCRYIVVSLGDDSTTLSTALRIYRLIKRERVLHDLDVYEPVIHVRIRDDENLQLFSTKEDKSVFKHFVKFGSDEDIYSADQVGQSVLDKLAEQARDIYREEHKLKNNEKTAYAYLPESEKNANQAAALHVLYKLHYFQKIKFEKTSDNLSKEERKMIPAENQQIFDRLVLEEERLKVADWEHIRWQAYMRTEGYVHCPYEQTEKIFNKHFSGDWGAAVKQTRAELRQGRMHPCIGSGDTNEEQQDHLKKIALLIGDPNDEYHFHKNDRSFVDSIPKIIGGIYKIVDTTITKKEGQTL